MLKQEQAILDYYGLGVENLLNMTDEDIRNHLLKYSTANIIDKQSGILKSGDNCIRTKPGSGYHGNIGKAGDRQITYGDEGGASRVLHKCDFTKKELELSNCLSKYERGEYDLVIYNPKASKHERESLIGDIETKPKTNSYAGGGTKCTVCGKPFLSGGKNANHCKCDKEIYGKNCERMENPKLNNCHPCLKALSLNFKILKLFYQKFNEQKLYIPFVGVFSEFISAIAVGFKEENIYGCEIDPHYIKIGKARLRYWKENDFYFKEGKEKQIKKKATIKKKEDRNFIF